MQGENKPCTCAYFGYVVIRLGITYLTPSIIGRGAVCPLPLFFFCLLLKMSPYLKILDQTFLLPMPLWRKKKVNHPPLPSHPENFEISVQKPPMDERVNVANLDSLIYSYAKDTLFFVYYILISFHNWEILLILPESFIYNLNKSKT